MAKNTFAIFGILAVLLLSLGLTSAFDGFELSITGQGTSDNKITGTNGTTHTVLVNANNTLAQGTVYVNWSVASTTIMTLPAGANVSTGAADITGFIFTMPTSGTYKTLTANIHNATTHEEIGTSTVRIYFDETSTPAEISGCTDSTATNYDSTATVDDESCTYASSNTYCELDSFGTEKGHLEITSFEINNKGSGDDEEWEYLDEIEIEVTIENTDDENINDIMVEILIKDNNGNTMTKKDMDLNDDEIDLGKIKDDEEEIATFKIDELPIDLDSGKYTIYVRAYEDGNEDNECVSESDDFTDSDETYFEFEVVESEDATVIVKRDLNNIQASCGDENVEVKFMVYNAGDDDEEKVLVTLENSKLGIYEKIIIDNLRDGKGKEVAFYVTMPEEIVKNSNTLDIYTYYDYDDDEEELDESSYGESSEEEGDDFSIGLEILSCQAKAPSVTANLESETKIGTDLVIKTTITNNGKLNNFVIAPTGFESWADLVSVTPQTAEIASGNTQEVVITLSPKASGAQTFKISTVVDGETYNQPVSVKIAEEPGMFSELGLSGMSLYLVAGIVALLVLIFLVLVVRVAQRPARAAEF